MKKNRKFTLKSQIVRNLSIPQLNGVAGGISIDPCGPSAVGGCNTVFLCVDTNGGACPTGGPSFQCPTVSCPNLTFGC